MSVGHCGNGCLTKGSKPEIHQNSYGKEFVFRNCKDNGCWCAKIGICRPWYLPRWLGKKLL